MELRVKAFVGQGGGVDARCHHGRLQLRMAVEEKLSGSSEPNTDASSQRPLNLARAVPSGPQISDSAVTPGS